MSRKSSGPKHRFLQMLAARSYFLIEIYLLTSSVMYFFPVLFGASGLPEPTAAPKWLEWDLSIYIVRRSI
ncbi:hypothetical protein DL98DRAFT_130368 [Cadophora sp. DSE1049]|nr:hypothetical protein DL98DRAFT_130368 [Cadophora sp. DSE1049]